MRYQLSRRDLLLATRAGAASIALAEMGVPAHAEDGFAISIVGGTWGQGQIRTYITETDFERKNNVKVVVGKSSKSATFCWCSVGELSS